MESVSEKAAQLQNEYALYCSLSLFRLTFQIQRAISSCACIITWSSMFSSERFLLNTWKGIGFLVCYLKLILTVNIGDE